MTSLKKNSVALVNPPFSPLKFANLGISVLAGGVKAKGFECKTFYWNHDFIDELPGTDIIQKRLLTERFAEFGFAPWNEWIFTRWVFPEGLSKKDSEVLSALEKADQEISCEPGIVFSEMIMELRNRIPELVEQMVSQLEPFNIIGISTTFFQNGAALALAKFTKERFPEKMVVLGGANCDGEMGKALLEISPFVDHVFSGEVDHAFPDFLECLEKGASFEGIHGLLRRDLVTGSILGEAAPPISEMDQLPIPNFDDYLESRKKHDMFKEDHICLTLESSRGCWWGAKSHCTFCGLNARGMGYRQKSPERFQEEVLELHERYDARYFFMSDNILSNKYFHDFLLWAKEQDWNVDLFYEIKANVSHKQAKILSDAGATWIQPGIEHFSSSILKLMRKGITGIMNIAFLKYAREYGLRSSYFILAGFPGEDEKEYDLMISNFPKMSHLEPPIDIAEIQIHRFSPYHNTPENFGLQLKPEAGYSFIYPFSRPLIERIAYRFVDEGHVYDNLPYQSQLEKAIASWQESFDADYCTLVWELDGSDVVVFDRRPGYPSADYRLTNGAAAVFLELNAPRSLRLVQKSLKKQTAEKPFEFEEDKKTRGRSYITQIQKNESNEVVVIDFSKESFYDYPESCIEPLIEADILLREGDLYMFLPIFNRILGFRHGWKQLRAGS